MPLTKRLLDNTDEPYDWGAAIDEIGRHIQDGLDAIWAFLHSVVEFFMQLPELLVNMFKHIDFDNVKQDIENGVHAVIQFLFDHECLVAAAFFVLSLILGFPIGMVMSTILYIPQMIFIRILQCIGARRTDVEQDILAASYPSRNYGTYTLPDSRLGSSQPPILMRQRIGKMLLLLLRWLSMITSIILFVHSFYNSQQAHN